MGLKEQESEAEVGVDECVTDQKILWEAGRRDWWPWNTGICWLPSRMFVMIAKERIRCPGLQAMRSGKLADAQLPAHEVHAASNRKHPFSASGSRSRLNRRLRTGELHLTTSALLRQSGHCLTRQSRQPAAARRSYLWGADAAPWLKLRIRREMVPASQEMAEAVRQFLWIF